MMAAKNLLRLLVTALLFTGVRAAGNTLFVYSRVGDDVILPCTDEVHPNCPSNRWSFYKSGAMRFTKEVIRGEVSPESDKSSRLSLRPDCSLHIRDLKADDAGSYECEKLHAGNRSKLGNINVYLSLLSISSPTPITELKPGGKLTLSCMLFTYYDAGSCRSSISTIDLTWLDEDGAELPKDSRNETRDRCNATMSTTLQKGDDNRKWRCQLSNSAGDKVTFLDFRSTFLLHMAKSSESSTRSQEVSTTKPDPVQLPYSRIALCVALPVMVMVVAFYTRRMDRKARAKAYKGIELQEIN